MGDALNGSVLDPSAAGIEVKLLTGDFTLYSLTVRAEVECDDPSTEHVALDYSWVNSDGSIQLWISQRTHDEPGAPTYCGTAGPSSGSDGYYFTVSANYAYPMYYDDTPEGDDVAHRVRP